MEQLRCTVQRIIFRNEQNGFSVLKCSARGSRAVNVVGTLPGIQTGADLALEGEWRTDSRYGRQFYVSAWEEIPPEPEEAPKEMPAPVLHEEDLFRRLARSEFRSRFSLKEKDRAYVQEKGLDTIRSHAHDFIGSRLAPAHPKNDGKQTPMRGHPVFIAQHATATCCRSCLEKWHHIPQGVPLSQEQQDYVVDVIMAWIERQMRQAAAVPEEKTNRQG